MLQKIYCSQYILTAMQQHFFAKKTVFVFTASKYEDIAANKK